MSWPVVKLGEVAESIDYGVTASASVQEIGPKFLRITDIQDGSVNWSTVPYCDAAPKKLSDARLQSGDIVFARTGATTGKSFLIRSCPECAVFASYLIRVRPGPSVEPSYLSHFFDSSDYWNQISLKASGAAQPGVNSSKLKELTIPLPPLPEQRRIAAILDQADALRRLRAQALDKLNSLGQAIFHEMFGDVANNTKNLPKAKVGAHCERISVGVVIKPASYYQEQGVPAIRGTNIKPDGIDLSDIVFFSEEATNGPLRKSRINTGDVLAVRSGRPGQAAVVPPELDGANCIDVLIATTRKETLLPEYLRDFLNSPDGRSLVLSNSVGQVQQHFNVKSLAGAEIPLPSMELQHAYLKSISALDANRSDLIEATQAQKALFASLQHRAFRGEL